MQKVLIVTYYWPPGSGAGVQRWLKFAKYLPQSGWEPVILTVDPASATYPALDLTLDNDIPSGLAIHKTRATDYFRFYNKDKSRIPSAGFARDDNNSLTGKISRFIRGNFFIPDPRKGWNKYAFRKACEIIENEKIKSLITTSPPHSTQLIGLRLKKKFPTIRWIADLRDPWTDIYYYNRFYPTFISKAIDREYELKVLKTADRILTVGDSLKRIFAAKYPGVEHKTTIITNGYDKADFTGERPEKQDIFTISYIGTLSDIYPTRSLLEVLKGLSDEGVRFRLRLVGTLSPGQKALIGTVLPSSYTEFIPYSDHSKAIRYMQSSDLLLLVIPDHISSVSIITGKLFEYLASCRPVMCLGPAGGDAATILKESGHGKCFDYNDTSGMIKYLCQASESEKDNALSMPEEYSREILTLKVAEVLSGVN